MSTHNSGLPSPRGGGLYIYGTPTIESNNDKTVMIPMGRIQLLKQNTITDYSQGENLIVDGKVYISQREEANEDYIKKS